MKNKVFKTGEIYKGYPLSSMYDGMTEEQIVALQRGEDEPYDVIEQTGKDFDAEEERNPDIE